MISHFDHIALTVADTDRAVPCYKAVLKMALIIFVGRRRAVPFGQQKTNFQ